MAVGDLIAPSHLLRRVATTTTTANSGNITTTETSVATVSGVLEAGQRYGITVYSRWAASAVGSPSAETTLARIREDSVSGTEITAGQVGLMTASTVGFSLVLYAEYTAVTTGSKTFAFTGIRNGGANNHTLRASTSAPCLFFVDLILS